LVTEPVETGVERKYEQRNLQKKKERMVTKETEERREAEYLVRKNISFIHASVAQ
jgi:hypothetical protein